MPTSLNDLTDQQLDQWLADHHQPAFRRKQIREWNRRRLVTSFDDMANLPKTLREALADDLACSSLTQVQKLNDDDRTVKWLFRLHDGHTIETVLIRAPRRNTVCISTQVGCQVRCVFCASGKKGLARNLTPAEIVDQVIAASQEAGQLVSNVVVMGMGEPLHNLDSLVPALETICSPDGLGLGARHITVSTSGIPRAIRQLGALQRPWNLAISLHAVDDDKRAKLIPPRHRAPVADILDAAKAYREMTTRMVTLEYILIANFNDSHDDANALADIARDLHAKVNLIPSNTDDPHYPPSSPQKAEQFLAILTKRNVQATLRLRKGKNIDAACGMLRRRLEEQEPQE